MANYLQVLITTCFFVFSFMEMAMFYVYNLKVKYETRFIKSFFDFVFLQFHPWLKIIRGSGQIVLVDDNDDTEDNDDQ